MNKISAKIIADSITEQGHRLTTFVLVFPRIVLAEFNTHRMLSRNSASSRAIPFEKMVKMVKEEPFIPIKWMKDHKGMQGSEFFEDENQIKDIELTWLTARIDAIYRAKELNEIGLTKQIANRLLEPFMWHTVIVTGSEWGNFFALRAHEAAEIHIQELANKMLTEYNGSLPKLLKGGQWHIPFGDKMNKARLYEIASEQKVGGAYVMNEIDTLKIKIATARCARVSYLNFDGKDDYEADIKLHNQLLVAGHMSPFEHCARAMTNGEILSHIRTNALIMKWDDINGPTPVMNERDFGWSGNFQGFIQYRKTMSGENKFDERVKKIENDLYISQ